MSVSSKICVNFLIFLFTTFLCFGVSELFLRQIGFVPGVFIKTSDLESIPVDFSVAQVYPINILDTDSSGVLRVNTQAVKEFKFPQRGMLADYSDYFNVSVDSLGFRGCKINNGKSKILLIGDSYTWGYSAKPIDSSFSDILSSVISGYDVYNASIPGVDVVSYKKVLELLMPELKPDLVIVNFFSGNDFVFYNKVLKPEHPNDLYLMNVGCTMNVNYDSYGKDSVEVFSDYLSSYNYIKNKLFIPDSYLGRVMSKSVLTTLFFKTFFSKKYLYKNVIVEKYAADSFATRRYLVEMDKLCSAYGAKMIFSVIPDETDVENEHTYKLLSKNLDNQFGDYLDYKLIGNLRNTDYSSQLYDTHFNNSGHRKYADYLKEIIEGQ